jgi:Flp pilus assembly protein TadG
MRASWRKFLRLFKGHDKGTVAVTFLLSLPILLTVIGVLVQYALLANARLTVDRAVQAAARSAMTALPTDPVIGEPGGAAYVERSAFMILESLSPASPQGGSTDGIMVAAALQDVGANPPASYAARFNYAQQATRITIEPINSSNGVVPAMDYPRTAAPRVRITVTYDFQLTVPLLKNLTGRSDTVAGITGRFTRMTSSLDVQLSHGRQAPTNAFGEP